MILGLQPAFLAKGSRTPQPKKTSSIEIWRAPWESSPILESYLKQLSKLRPSVQMGYLKLSSLKSERSPSGGLLGVCYDSVVSLLGVSQE